MSQLRPLRSGGDSGEARVDLAPLIDVVFLLLIFYVVAATFTRPTAVPVQRPVSSQAASLPERPVVITIGADGGAWLGDRSWDPGHIAAVRDALTRRGSERVLVHADGSVPTRELVQVIDACRAAGATSVDLAADQEGR